MWKKDDMPTNSYTPEPERTARPDLSVSSSAPSPSPSPTPVPPATGSSGQRATIGRSITIRGDVTGDEDLLIQGRVDGSIDLKQHAVTIGGEGEVKASIVGRVVIVEGSVEGNINSEEQVVLRSSARVKGDITAPRLVLEDGARFRGGVDMGEVSDRGRSTATPAAQSQAKRPEAVTSTPSTSDSTKTSESARASEGSSKPGESTSDASGSSKRKGGTEAVAEATA